MKRDRSNRANVHLLSVGQPPAAAPPPVADPLGGACRHCLRTLRDSYWATDILEIRYQMHRDGWSFADTLEELEGIVAAMRSVGEAYEWLCNLEGKAEDIDQDDFDERETAALVAWLALQDQWKAEDEQEAGL